MSVCLSYMNYYTFHSSYRHKTLGSFWVYSWGSSCVEFLFLFRKGDAQAGSDDIFLYLRIKVGCDFDTVHMSAMKFLGVDEKVSAKKKK